MRKTVTEQLPLMPDAVDHKQARVFEKISEQVDAEPQIAALAFFDLAEGGAAYRGRLGMSGDRAIRIAFLKGLTGLSYEDLEFALADSTTYRRFCKLGLGEAPPSKSAMQANVKRLRPETLELVNRLLVSAAQELGLEDARKIRSDCTVVEANIHKPSDSSLLWDTVRVLDRFMGRAMKFLAFTRTNSAADAKRTNIEIFYGHKGPKRDAAYCRLMDHATRFFDEAQEVAAELRLVRGSRPTRRRAVELAAEIEHYLDLGRQVHKQTHARIVCGQQTPADEKILSVFEPHTDVIVPSHRQVAFGHKACLTVGESALILDLVVEQGAPADVTLALRQAKRAVDVLGHTPDKIVFDGAFASRENLEAIKALGYKDVAFSKSPNISARDQTRSPRTHHLLKKFRAGIEGCISFFKRRLGMGRCTWRGEESFKAYVWLCAVSANLLTIARGLLLRA